MKFFKARFYSDSDIEQLDKLEFPYSDKFATYDGMKHQYVLTEKYFTERGRNLQEELEGDSPDKVNVFLRQLSTKVYNFVYNNNKSTRNQLNYMIAKRGLRGYDMYQYRQAFLEAMLIEGEYLLDNGDPSAYSGIDFDTMQNMSIDVMRKQNRDFHIECIRSLNTLGLNYHGAYKFSVTGEGVDW